MTGVRKQRQTEAHKSVSSHFQQHPCQYNTAGRWSFHMSIRQPGMKRKHWYLYCKREEECKEEPELSSKWNVEVVYLQQVKCVFTRCIVMHKIEEYYGNQHQYTSCHCIYEELYCGIYPSRASPYTNYQVHRNQHKLPEHVEEEEVKRDKHSQHPRLQDEHRNHILFDPVLYVPRCQYADERKETCQQEKEETYAVDTYMITYPKLFYPWNILYKLEFRCI